MNTNYAILVALLGACTLAAPVAAQPQLYYSSSTSIWKQQVPGGPRAKIFEGTYDGRPMWLATDGQSLYWTAYSTGELWTSGMGGEDARVLTPTPGSYPRGVAMHSGHVYWGSRQLGKIFRTDLSGSSVEQVYSGPNSRQEGPDDIEIYGDRIYWTSWSSSWVMTCALDGSDYRTMALPDGGRAFAIEIADDAMYIASNGWGGSLTGRLLRYTMDGTSFVELSSGHHIMGMDVLGDRIYFNDEDGHDIYSVLVSGGDERLETDFSSWQLLAVPEPATLALLAIGGLAMLRRRKRG